MKKVIAHIFMNIGLAALLVLTTTTSVLAQGWERVLSGLGQEELFDVANYPSGGYVAVGSFNKQNQIYLVKTYVDGTKQWAKQLGSVAQTSGRALTLAPNGDIYIAGFADGFGANGRDFILLKTDSQGNLLWQKNYGGAFADEAYDLVQTTDGGLLLTGFKTTNPTGNKDIFLVKTDADGGLLWEKTFGDAQLDEEARSLVLLPDGGAALVGSVKQGLDLDILVLRTDANGNQIWQNTYGFDISSNVADEGRAGVLAADGSLIVAGFTTKTTGNGGNLGVWMKINLDTPTAVEYKTDFDNAAFYGLTNCANGGYFASGYRDFGTNLDFYIAHLDVDGNKIWERNFGGGGPDAGNAVIESADGGAVVAGFKQPNLLTSYAYLVKTDASGVIYTDQIQGNVFQDFNVNCQLDNGEAGLEDWIVKISKPAGDFERYAAANAGGFYKAEVDTGTYKIQLFQPNAYWKPCQPNGYTATLTGFYDTATIDIPVQVLAACPSLNIDIVTPTLVKCAENTYIVSYCNEGTIAAVNAKIEVTFDEKLTVLNSSLAWTSVVGKTYTFEIGYINVGQCGSFSIKTFLDCAAETGATQCVKAHAFPDTFCKQAFPNWDGSILRASGKCENNKVKLEIKNVGTSPMSQPLEYIVIEDVIMLVKPGAGIEPPLNEAESFVWTMPNDANGRTLRIVTQQTPGYPGASYPSAAVEGCKADTSSATPTHGFFTAFADDESEPFLASDCQEIIDQSPASIKTGHPKGVGVEHFISDSTDLEYLIRFQNTGTDTVFEVVIRDTLSKWLDPTTVQPGAGSHPYDFEVYENGIVLFRIPNTLLIPAGSVGDDQSSGFVHFRVSQKPITPCDTLIVNRAAIFFNHDDPFTTNSVMHKVCHDILHYISVKTNEIVWPQADVQVSPNPFIDYADFEIKGVEAKKYKLELFDAAGKTVFMRFYDNPNFRLHRYQLTAGVFFYRLSADGKSVASGQIIGQ